MSQIITERLLMRPFEAADINYLIHLKGSKTNMADTTVGPLSADQATQQLDHYLSQWQTDGLGIWSLTHKMSGAFVGECGFIKRPDMDDYSLRYTLNHSWWGQGLASEAVKAALNYGLSDGHFQQISALALATNIRSCRILESAGMHVIDTDFGGVKGFRRYQRKRY